MSLLPLPIRTKSAAESISKEALIIKPSQFSKPSLSSPLKKPEESLSPSLPPTSELISLNEIESETQFDIVSTDLIRTCCGENCCKIPQKIVECDLERIEPPDNEAYRSLQLKIESIPKVLSGIPEVPPKTVSILPINDSISHISADLILDQGSSDSVNLTHTETSTTNADLLATASANDFKIESNIHPPKFVKPHAPYDLYIARIHSARELTQPGAEKRTYHFDLDVTDYPVETGVDFKVGGAIGVSAPNIASAVDEFLDLLCVPRYLRDRPILLKTSSGRWPTVWGDDKPRELQTTRREILTWCSDFQSFRVGKSLLRLLAEYATSESEKKILYYLTSDQGQSTFCDLRTGPYITVPQLLYAFPSCKPPLDAMLSILPQLVARFYSLSNDPIDTSVTEDGNKRIIEFAVTVWEVSNWDGSIRTGIGSGFLERMAKKFIEVEKRGEKPNISIPMFKGLMSNPLARDFASDGPMLLIGAGVGISPFRGFVQRRLRNANCANKVWVLQGIRDSLFDELYRGEWGIHEADLKKVIQSRKPSGQSKYVQDEVRAQADLVWFIINSLDGRIFVCGSSRGMSEGVTRALVDVAKLKGNLDEDDAQQFWSSKKEAGQFVVEAW
ncbi:putative fad binding domain-containing protein [Erysiphe necator]|uniref:Putative fad binding domain-containing protein n=1 Tax=Uncinula necator TaxID=52586 RepID=A0A0B1PAV0_UNCNE|nr:putative fad binding domain-containing protein [Erysiphe necator]